MLYIPLPWLRSVAPARPRAEGGLLVAVKCPRDSKISPQIP